MKHEEIMLELESIRAKRERLLPFCPNCSTQQIAMYQPIQQHVQNTNAQNTPPQYGHLPAQPLLSISIPQQQMAPSNMSPSNMSPYQQVQAQAHLSHYQVITLPGKQSVTVECQTSPINELPSTKKYEPQPIIQQQKKIEKATVSCQTCELIKKLESREMNTDPIDFSFLNKKQPVLPVVKPVMKHQSQNVNLFTENPKVLEDKVTILV